MGAKEAKNKKKNQKKKTRTAFRYISLYSKICDKENNTLCLEVDMVNCVKEVKCYEDIQHPIYINTN